MAGILETFETMHQQSRRLAERAVVIAADARFDSGIPGCDAGDECPATSYRDRAGDERRWLHARTEDGEQGRARSESLAWAE